MYLKGYFWEAVILNKYFVSYLEEVSKVFFFGKLTSCNLEIVSRSPFSVQKEKLPMFFSGLFYSTNNMVAAIPPNMGIVL